MQSERWKELVAALLIEARNEQMSVSAHRGLGKVVGLVDSTMGSSISVSRTTFDEMLISEILHEANAAEDGLRLV